MPVWPKSFYTFGVSLKTAATEWKLRQKRSAIPAQEQALKKLTARLATTSHWKAAGIETGMPYDQFRSRVPLSRHEQLAPAIERMQRGESDVLWPGRCELFAHTAGTSTGTGRPIPVTEEMLEHVRFAGYDAALYYTVRAKNAGAFRGRQLLFGSQSTLKALGDPKAPTAYTGDLTGIAALNLPRWAERHLYEPGAAAAQAATWEARISAIVARTARCDVTMTGGLPSWLLLLAQAIRTRNGEGKARLPTLQGLWPNLECCIHTGMPVAPYIDQLRTVLGVNVVFHELYAATEGFIATQDIDARNGLRLMADRGVFFEFLPMAEYDETKLEQLGARALPLAAVKAEVDYALVLTTPGGLARYVLGDVVRFTSLAPHRLVYVGGTRLRLNAFGEQVAEREVSEALTTLCQRRDWSIVNFHIAPRFTSSERTGHHHGRHEWWVELKPGTIATPTGPQMAAELDIELLRSNETYATKRKSGILDAPVVRLVMPGVFEHWLRFHNHWGGQHKVPRCRSDRIVADELAQITNFAID
ncbi:MAG: GH3 auxin-responsive promoter family protein [Verrucomicrobiota bacterium]